MTAGTESASLPTAVVVFGGSGVIGGSVINAVLRDPCREVIATYCRSHPPQRPRTTWVRFDDAEGNLGDVVLEVDAAPPLAAIVYCIGVSSSKDSIVETEDTEWCSLFIHNAATFVSTYRALHQHARSHSASVVVVSSETSRTLRAGNAPYSASKCALEAIALTLAKEESRYGVRVNIVAPARVSPGQTCPWTPSGKRLTPWETGSVIATVALDEAWSYANGQIVNVSASGADSERRPTC